MPGGGNTGKKTTAYTFVPSDSDSPQSQSVIPLSVEKKKVGDAVQWDINGDEYAVVKEQAILSGTSAPDTLQKAIEETAQEKTRWWIGLGQTTRLYSKVDQHTPTDTDESDLMQRCAVLWAGLADRDIGFEVRPMSLKKSSMTAMIRSEDFGTAGASLIDTDTNADASEDEDDESADSNQSNPEKIAAFKRQCTRVLDKIHGDARPILSLLGRQPGRNSHHPQDRRDPLWRTGANSGPTPCLTMSTGCERICLGVNCAANNALTCAWAVRSMSKTQTACSMRSLLTRVPNTS